MYVNDSMRPSPMLRNLTAVFEPADEGGYVCWFEELPEVMSQGDDIEDAKRNLLDALKEVVQYRRDQAEERIKKENSKSRIKKIQSISIAV